MSNLSLSLFDFNSQSLRVVVIDESIWIIATDICRILEIKNTSDALKNLDTDEVRELSHELLLTIAKNYSSNTAGLLAVSESGFYKLVLRSRKPQAKPFQQWVTKDVIPSIRQKGRYLVEGDYESLAKEQIDIACFALDKIFEKVKLKPELLAQLKFEAVNTISPGSVQAIAPAKQLLINATAQEFRLLTPTDIGKQLGISAQKVNKKLIEMGFQIKNSDRKSRKEPAYIPTNRGSEFADLTLAGGSGSDATTYQQLRWYESVISVF